MKNLVFLAKVLHRLDHAGRLLTSAAEEEGGSSFERDGGRGQGSEFVKRDLEWLITRLSRLAKFEAAHHPKESKKVSFIDQLHFPFFVVLYSSLEGAMKLKFVPFCSP